jgi:hypothetical protein
MIIKIFFNANFKEKQAADACSLTMVHSEKKLESEHEIVSSP